MTTPEPDPDQPVPSSDRRKASFVGLSLGRMGTGPFDLITHTYLALLLADRTSSAVAITFALTAHQYVLAVLLPVAGRLSDRTIASGGRRVPYVVSGLAVAAAAVWMFTVVDGYWPLVAVVVLARAAEAVSLIGRIGSTPDVFGRSRWILASVSMAIVGILPGAATLAIVQGTWEQDDPATWDTTFRLAAIGLAVSAVAIALLVRESPASRTAAKIAAARSWKEEAGEFFRRPNAKVVVGGFALLGAGEAAVERLLPVWANEIVGAGGSDLARATAVIAVGSAALVPFGLWLSGRAHPRHLAVLATGVAAAVAFAHVWVTSITMFVIAAIIVVPLSVAALAAAVPVFLRLVPRSDNVTETFGILIGPVSLVTSVVSYFSAATVDLLGSYRVIWIISGTFITGAAVAFSRLQIPAGEERTDIRAIYRRLRAGSGEGRGVMQRLFGGDVRDEDVIEGEVVAGEKGD